MTYAIGGSTNAVLHLMALAREAGLSEAEFSITSFNRFNDTVPIIINLSPHGPYHMVDLDRVGGLPVVMKELLVCWLGLYKQPLILLASAIPSEGHRALLSTSTATCVPALFVDMLHRLTSKASGAC